MTFFGILVSASQTSAGLNGTLALIVIIGIALMGIAIGIIFRKPPPRAASLPAGGPAGTPAGLGAYGKFSLVQWLTTTNHKDIGLLYIATSIYFLVIGGSMGELMRFQLATPNGTLLSAFTYSQVVSFHGLIMILWFLSPLGTGLANYFVPLQIGAKDMAFPRLNAMSYWLYLFSGLLLVSTAFLPGGGPGTGWTLYAPLNTTAFQPQPGMDVAALALAMLAASVTMSSVNILTTIIRTRTRGIKWWSMPIFSWSVMFTNVLMLFAFPSLLVGTALLTADRTLGTVFFSSNLGGSLLWDQLFWYFGHPEVYVVVLPALGIMAEVIMTFSKNILFGKKIFIAELFAVTGLSLAVWIHHMFMTGISMNVTETFMLTTLAISVPFEGLVVGLVLTLRKGSIRITTPFLFAMGAIFFVTIGGLTGVFQASTTLDYAFRGTYWVVGHFHYVMVGTTIFGLIAGLYYWFPKITKKMYNEAYGKILFLVSFIGFNILYFPYFLLIDMPRRVSVYPVDPQWWYLNLIATVGAVIFGPAILLTLYNLIHSYMKGKTCEENPWNVDSCEWTGNYLSSRTHESARQVGGDSPAVLSLIDSGGGSAMPSEQAEAHGPKSAKLGMTDRANESGRPTWLPLVISIGVALSIFGFVMFVPLGITGLLVVAASAVSWFRDDIRDKFAQVEEQSGEYYPYEKVSKVKFGLWIFIMSEVIIFGTMIAAYLYLRVQSSSWPLASQVHSVVIGTANTFILLTSGLAMILAYQFVKGGNIKGLKTSLVAAFALGSAFLVLKLAVEWPQEFASGFVVSGGVAPSTYYSLMGAHAIHVGIGLVGIAYLIFKSYAGKFSPQSHTAVELIGIYWVFVDIVWMFLFPLFYLI